MEHYKLNEVLGEGAEGRIQLAINKQTKERVAIKSFKAHPNLRKNMKREAKILIDCCQHENIISLKHYSSSQEFMVYELVEGGSLEDKMEMKLSSNEIRLIMKQILSGLAYLHEKSYMHLDLKPSNILIVENQTVVKLADFGHARKVSSKIYNGVPGSIPYNAPELLLGLRSYGTEMDVWSAGWIFLQLLIGEDFSFSEIEYRRLIKIHDEEEQQKFCERIAMKKIITWLGKPEEKNWPNVSRLPNYVALVEDCPINNLETRNIRREVRNPAAAELVLKMLTLDPQKRISAKEALKSIYFKQNEKVVPLTSEGVTSFISAWTNKIMKFLCFS